MLPFARTQHVPPVTLQIAWRTQFLSAQVPCPQPASRLFSHPWIQPHLPSPLIILLPHVSLCLFLQTENTHPTQASVTAGAVAAQKGSTVPLDSWKRRMLRDRAAGPASSHINTIHLLITLDDVEISFPPGSLPRSHSSQHHHHTQLRSTHSSLGLTAGIEDTFLDFEMQNTPKDDLQKSILPTFSLCPAVWIGSLQVWKKQRAAEQCWQNRGGNFHFPGHGGSAFCLHEHCIP